jgi:catechol 2,3-dioxygenase
VFIETGPHKHAIQQTFFLYVYEPGGNRIELCNPVARLVLAPESINEILVRATEQDN